jgi:hypothetical protein
MSHALLSRVLISCLLLTACSAEVDVEAAADDQAVPLISLLEPVYAEVAIDIPPEAQGDIILQQISVSLTVRNPTRALSLEAGARLSFKGQATPEEPVLYSNANLPDYFNEAAILLPSQVFAPGEQKAFTIDNPVLVQAAGKPRIWLIVNNTVRRVGLGTDTLPVNILLEDIVFRATVTKPFPNVGGALEVGGL